jgi:uncharacterized protein (DUF4415 family)
MAIKRYTREQIRSMKSLTDWEARKNIKDEDIDLTDPDAPDMSERIKKGLLVPAEHPYKILATTKEIRIRVDNEIFEKLRASGAGWQTRLSKKISEWVSSQVDEIVVKKVG